MKIKAWNKHNSHLKQKLLGIFQHWKYNDELLIFLLWYWFPDDLTFFSCWIGPMKKDNNLARIKNDEL